MTRRDPDLGGIRPAREWGFSADDMAAVQQQHARQARRCRWTVAVLAVLAVLAVVVAVAAVLGWWT